MELALKIIAFILGSFLVVYFLWEAFETVVLPRTVTHNFRFARNFFRFLWFQVWRKTAARIEEFRTNDTFLSYFGPLSLILLLGAWAWALIFGFALIDWAVNVHLRGVHGEPSFGTALYYSGVTFYTLGYGDITPESGIGRAIAVIETGTGFGFLAITIGYVPVIYSAFSRREAGTTLLDARAGSPPTALEMLCRHSRSEAMPHLQEFLKDMERWCSDILESTLSYPVLAFYRSQHDDQSWLSAIIVVMDTCAVIMTGLKGVPKWQAKMTYAICCHALVDFCVIFSISPAESYLSRLTPSDIERITRILDSLGIDFLEHETAAKRLDEIRNAYEPYAVALARNFAFVLPPFAAAEATQDDWQRTSRQNPNRQRSDTHF